MPVAGLLRWSLAVLATGVIVRCERLPDFATEKPDARALAGRYLPDADARDWLQEQGLVPEAAWIELEVNGRFAFGKLPAGWLSPLGADVAKGTDSGTGSWELLRGQTSFNGGSSAARWNLFLRIEATTPESSFRQTPFDHGAAAMVSRRKPPHTLSLLLMGGGRQYLTFRRDTATR